MWDIESRLSKYLITYLLIHSQNTISCPPCFAEAPVMFVRGLQPIAAKEGDTVHLRVELSRPGDNAIWSRNGNQVLPDEHISIKIDGRELSLNIFRLTFEDRGIYSCETNHDHTRARLSVERKFALLTCFAK